MKTNPTSPTRSICEYTLKRSEACACGGCARFKTADAKLRANNRDILALLNAIARRIQERESLARATWGHVGTAADVRERLLQVAISLSLADRDDEQAARRRLEEALCADEDSVSAKLADAI